MMKNRSNHKKCCIIRWSDWLADDVTDECPSIIATRFKRNYQKEIKFNVKNV